MKIEQPRRSRSPFRRRLDMDRVHEAVWTMVGLAVAVALSSALLAFTWRSLRWGFGL